MTHKPLVVVDKSYLQGAPKDELKSLFDTSTVLMPEVLFAELLTADPVERAICFRRLPKKENPVELVAGTSDLLRFEIANQVPCTPLWKQRVAKRFTFNPSLTREDLQYEKEAKAVLAEWENDRTDGISLLEESFVSVQNIFPNLKGFVPGSDRALIERFKSRVATEDRLTRDFYEAYRPERFPPGRLLTRRWLLFVRTQVYLLAALDYIFRYGDCIGVAASKAMGNESKDLEYTVTGVLARGLATAENTMKARFSLLCPQGALVTYRQDAAA